MANDSVRIRVDTGELERSLRDYMAYTSKTLPEAVNKIAIDVAFQAEKVVTRSAFKTVSWEKLAYVGTTTTTTVNKALFHALATGKTRFGKTRFGAAVKGQGNEEIAKKIFESRGRAVNYSRAIFIKLAEDLGKVLRRSVGRGLPRNASATKARKSIRPQASLNVDGVEKRHADDVLQPAMQRGIDAAAKDKREYITRKIAEGARRHSGRRR